MISTSIDIKDIALRSIDIMRDGSFADFEDLIHPEAINREAKDEPPECSIPGPAGFYATALWLRAAFSDLRWEPHAVIAEGDLVVVHCTMSGRHTAAFVGYLPDGSVDQAFPPTGEAFATTQTHWLRVRDGKVIEHWANRDDLGTARQLGWVPPSPAYIVRMTRATRRAKREAQQA
jgi:predicted ester cyclase